MRIARADECAYGIAELAAQWSLSGPLDLVQIRRGDRYTVQVRGIRPIPPRIYLLFSEAVNHLRAALDNVVWHLVETEQGPVTGRAALLVNLPIVNDEAGFIGWQNKRVGAGLTAFASTGEIARRIRELQPFVDLSVGIPSLRQELASLMDTPVELAHPLKLLQSYSNDDKHRTIRVTVPRSSGGRVDQFTPQSRRFVELNVGDVVAEGVWGEYAELEHSPGVQVQRPVPYAAFVTPAQEISRLAAYVAHVAVPRLLTGSAAPEPLPLEVDLDDSGLTDLQRLQAGGHEPAGERFTSRMTQLYLEASGRPVQYLPLIDLTSQDEPGAAGS